MVKNMPANAGGAGCRRHRFDPEFRKIPWRRKRQPTPYSCLKIPSTEESRGLQSGG